MRHLAFSAAAALALLAGCKDQPKQTPTEPPAAVVTAEERVPEQQGASTLCAAYRKQLGEARAALARSGGDDEPLRESVATYEAVIADACP
jgi:hypothetical protein